LEKSHCLQSERHKEATTAEWLAAEELPSVTKLSLEIRLFPLLDCQPSFGGGGTTLRAYISNTQDW
jgi:hypothetical protein